MNKEMNVEEVTEVGISEHDLLDFVAGISEGENAAVSGFIKEAVLDSLAFDIGLAPNDFELHYIRNSELFKLIQHIARKEGLSVATYIREAVIAARDRIVSERYLQEIFERPSLSWSPEGQQFAEVPNLAQERRVSEKKASIV